MVIVPKGFSDNLTKGIRGELKVLYYADPRFGGVALSVVEAVVEKLREHVSQIAISHAPTALRPYLEFVARPVALSKTPIGPILGETRLFFVLGIISVQIFFVGVYAGVNVVIERKRDKTLSLILSSPIKSHHIFLGDTLAAAFAVGISSLAVLATGYVLGIDYSTITPLRAITTAALLIIGLLSSIGLGLMLAPLAKTPETASALSCAL